MPEWEEKRCQETVDRNQLVLEHLPLLKQSSCAVRYWVEEAEVQLDDSAPMEECTPRGWMALRARWRA